MTESWTGRLSLLAGIGLGLLPIVSGAAVLAGDGDWNSTGDRVIWAAVMAFTGIAIIAGLLLIRRTYSRGMTLVAVGVAVLCVTTFWMAFITVPVGIVILILAHLRGRGIPAPQSTGTA